MSQERGGVYVQQGVDGDDEPILVHVDDLTLEERDAIREPLPVMPVVRDTRGGVFIDAPDGDEDGTREPAKHVDDMTPEEIEDRIGARDIDVPLDPIIRGA